MSLERLIAEHDEIEALAALLAAAVDSPMRDPLGVATLLSDLAIAIEEHRSNEQRNIYLRLLNDATAQPILTRFAEQYQSFEERFALYLNDWTAECIAADWESFRAESAVMLARLHQRVRQESTIIYPVALQRGAVRLRTS